MKTVPDPWDAAVSKPPHLPFRPSCMQPPPAAAMRVAYVGEESTSRLAVIAWTLSAARNRPVCGVDVSTRTGAQWGAR